MRVGQQETTGKSMGGGKNQRPLPNKKDLGVIEKGRFLENLKNGGVDRSWGKWEVGGKRLFSRGKRGGGWLAIETEKV